MLKVRELNVNSIFPKSFLDVLITECNSCGCEIEITETLTELRCSNLNCIETIALRMVSLLKNLGVAFLDTSNCKSFIRKHKTTNPYSILLYNPKTDGVLYDGCDMMFSHLVYNELNKVRCMFLWEYVSIGNIPNLKDVCFDLFKTYDNIDVFYSDLNKEGIVLVQKLLGLEVTDAISVRALNVYNTLIDYEVELKESVVGVEIKPLDLPILNIYISSVGEPYKNRSEFLDKINSLSKGKVHINILKCVTKDCDYLISSQQGNITSRVSKAIKYNIPILKGIEFEDYLRTRCL